MFVGVWWGLNFTFGGEPPLVNKNHVIIHPGSTLNLPMREEGGCHFNQPLL